MARKSRANAPQLTTAEPLQALFRVGFYLRLSVEDITDIASNSIGNQYKICQDYLKMQYDMALVDTYIDNGATGTNFQRQGFLQLMQDVKEGRINCIVVKDLSRFGRNFVEVSTYLEITFVNENIRFIAVTDGFDSFDKTRQEGLVVPIKNLLNEYYAKEISYKIRGAISHKKRMGEYLPASGSVPYGYRKDVANCTYVIDETVRPIIEEIYEMRVQKMGYHAIAATLNDRNVPSPRKLRLIRGETKDCRAEEALWSRATVRKILCNQSYLGHRIYGKTQKNELTCRKESTDQTTWQVVRHAHPPMIAEAIFAQVQQVNEQELRKHQAKEKCKNVAHDTRALWKGLLFCADCGSSMHASKYVQRKSTKADNFVNYRCGKHVRTNQKECKRHNIRDTALTNHITHIVEIQLKLCGEIEKLPKIMQDIREKQLDECIAQQKALQKSKAKNEKYRMRMTQDYMDGVLEAEAYLVLKEKYNQRTAEIATMEKRCKRQQESHKKRWKQASKTAQLLQQFSRNQILNRALLQCLFEKIEIHEDGSIEATLSYQNLFGQTDFDGEQGAI